MSCIYAQKFCKLSSIYQNIYNQISFSFIRTSASGVSTESILQCHKKMDLGFFSTISSHTQQKGKDRKKHLNSHGNKVTKDQWMKWGGDQTQPCPVSHTTAKAQLQNLIISHLDYCDCLPVTCPVWHSFSPFRLITLMLSSSYILLVKNIQWLPTA